MQCLPPKPRHARRLAFPASTDATNPWISAPPPPSIYLIAVARRTGDGTVMRESQQSGRTPQNAYAPYLASSASKVVRSSHHEPSSSVSTFCGHAVATDEACGPER